MKIYEAFNWIKDADYTPHGYLIFNDNTPEGQLKGEALKTIFEAAKNGELVTLEIFEAVKKERNEAVKRRNELLKEKNSQISDELTNIMITIESFQLRLWRSITIRAKISKDRLDMEVLN